MTHGSILLDISPVILAGGLGTRLRPRTDVLPKPLLSVAGRPLLWYALKSVSDLGLRRPIVVLAHKSNLIRAYFEGYDAEFRDLPDKTMAEAFFEVVESETSEAFLGMSSDALVPKAILEKTIEEYQRNGRHDTVLFTRLPAIGHKRWEFVVKDNLLQDVLKRDIKTNFERASLLMRRDSLLRIRDMLPKPVTEVLNAPLNAFQTGWTLILKIAALNRLPVHSNFVNDPICNINEPSDFARAEEFLRRYPVW